jgi:hypothetical protein
MSACMVTSLRRDIHLTVNANLSSNDAIHLASVRYQHFVPVEPWVIENGMLGTEHGGCSKFQLGSCYL